MSAFENLLDEFKKRLAIPWRDDVPAAARVWLLHYDKAHERRVRGRLGEFRVATEDARYGWRQFDLAPIFGAWISAEPDFEALAEYPSQLGQVIEDFEEDLAERLRSELRACGPNDLLAVTGVASLFGLTHASKLITNVVPTIKGRMMLTFPGTHTNGIYRLLDARDGWNYHAIPIPSAEVI